MDFVSSSSLLRRSRTVSLEALDVEAVVCLYLQDASLQCPSYQHKSGHLPVFVACAYVQEIFLQLELSRHTCTLLDSEREVLPHLPSQLHLRQFKNLTVLSLRPHAEQHVHSWHFCMIESTVIVNLSQNGYGDYKWLKRINLVIIIYFFYFLNKINVIKLLVYYNIYNYFIYYSKKNYEIKKTI